MRGIIFLWIVSQIASPGLCYEYEYYVCVYTENGVEKKCSTDCCGGIVCLNCNMTCCNSKTPTSSKDLAIILCSVFGTVILVLGFSICYAYHVVKRRRKDRLAAARNIVFLSLASNGRNFGPLTGRPGRSVPLDVRELMQNDQLQENASANPK